MDERNKTLKKEEEEERQVKSLIKKLSIFHVNFPSSDFVQEESLLSLTEKNERF